MKKQMKMMISIIITTVMLVVSIPLAFATGNNFSVILTAQNTVKRGGTIEVTVELDAFTGTGKGINTFMGSLEYDKTKLSIESSQIVAQNGWDSPMYENDKVLTAKGSMVTAKEAIMKMTFTVKSDAALGDTTITIKNTEASDDEYDFVGEDGTITIEIVEETSQPGENTPSGDEGENTPSGDETENTPSGDETENTPPTEEKDNTALNGDIPKAGSNTTLAILIIPVTIIGAIMYRKNKKYEDIK